MKSDNLETVVISSLPFTDGPLQLDLFDLFDSVVQTFTVTANRDAASICHFNPSFSTYLQLSLPHDFRVAITPPGRIL